jgi:hypothetical protein
MLQEYAPGQLFMYGGSGADGKPLNDAYLLEARPGGAWAWTCIYAGAPDLLPPGGAMAALLDRRLVTLTSGAGSSKLDVAQSLDILQVGPGWVAGFGGGLGRGGLGAAALECALQ